MEVIFLFCFLKTLLKFIYSEKATKICEISTLLLTVCTVVKSKVEISQNFVAFSEYLNFSLLRVPRFPNYFDSPGFGEIEE